MTSWPDIFSIPLIAKDSLKSFVACAETHSKRTELRTLLTTISVLTARVQVTMPLDMFEEFESWFDANCENGSEWVKMKRLEVNEIQEPEVRFMMGGYGVVPCPHSGCQNVTFDIEIRESKSLHEELRGGSNLCKDFMIMENITWRMSEIPEMRSSLMLQFGDVHKHCEGITQFEKQMKKLQGSFDLSESLVSNAVFENFKNTQKWVDQMNHVTREARSAMLRIYP